MTTTKIDFIDAMLYPQNATVSSSAAPANIKFIVGDNSRVYYGGYNSWASSATGAYDNTALEISTVQAGLNWKLVDGTNLLTISGSTGSVATVTTGGTGQPPSNARFNTLYRNRHVLGRTNADPQNLFFSSVGAYDTYDYDDLTVTGAFALNLPGTAGKVGDTVTSVIPWSDDYAIIGTTDSIFIMRGDPRNGGNVDAMVRGGGIVGPQAFAHDPEGRLYYMSRRDIMMIAGTALPVSISQGKLQKFLSTIDFSVYKVRMAWDIQAKGLWIFFTPATQAATYHLWWDARMDAFSVVQFPNAYGPTAVKSLAGETYQDRQTICGSFNGRLWTFSYNWITDSGTAINSYVQFPPIALAGELGERGVITETEFTVGALDQTNLRVQVFTGDNAQQAINNTDGSYIDFTVTEGGRVLNRERARGQTAVIKVSNDTLSTRWSLEGGYIRVQPAGRTR